MSAEDDKEIWFEIEIKDGADLDYFLWKSIQHKIAALSTKLRKIADVTNERTPPFNYLLKVRFTLKDLNYYEDFLKGRKEARELAGLKGTTTHECLTSEETRRLGR